MEGKRLIKSLTLTNFLSYGNSPVEVELKPLNVLIGANGSGKSNFLEALRLLQAVPRDLTQPIIQGGGIAEWLWKGDSRNEIAEIVAKLPGEVNQEDLLYSLSFTSVGQRIQIVNEIIEPDNPIQLVEPYYCYRYANGQPFLRSVQLIHDLQTGEDALQYVPRAISSLDLKSDQSILSQIIDPFSFPALSHIGVAFNWIAMYADNNLGKMASARYPQNADLPDSILIEDARNLALVLNDLDNRPGAMTSILEKLRQFYDRVEKISTRIIGGTVQVYLHEKGLQHPIPATRLSDGTLRYLCLLVVLCHPTPPPLVCIEEPELGLHPDIIPTIAELLIEASQRTQLIVTTHSDALVSALSDVPEAILVCERDDNGSRLERLEPDKLKEWLDKYSLGDLWLKGQIGGTRW